MTSRGKLAALVVATLGWTSAHAGLLNDGEPKAELQEGPVQLPAPPAMDKLLTYDVGPTSTMIFAVDPRSISVSDYVIVRFTSVIRSRSGATNISHEGIRCDTAEKKLYATGRADGSWTVPTNPAWRRIGDTVANRYHATLVEDYFCDGGTVAGTAETIVQRLRRQTPLLHPGKLR